MVLKMQNIFEAGSTNSTSDTCKRASDPYRQQAKSLTQKPVAARESGCRSHNTRKLDVQVAHIRPYIKACEAS